METIFERLGLKVVEDGDNGCLVVSCLHRPGISVNISVGMFNSMMIVCSAEDGRMRPEVWASKRKEFLQQVDVA